jgi:glycyl-tRNA synthetase beta chain
MSTFLFEIGCEELPAKVCESIERQLLGDRPGSGSEDARPGIVQRLFEEQRLWPAGDTRGDDGPQGPAAAPVRVLVSPRRIAVLVAGVPEQQTALVQSFRGPRASVAFDDAGAPTKAGAGFARSRGVTPEQLGREVFDGAEFVNVVVEEERRPAVAVAPTLCAGILQQIHVPRGMRWDTRPADAADYLRFSRPIRWLVCKLGERTVPFRFYDLDAGDVSLGHRVLGAPVTVTAADDYERLLEGQAVIVDQQRRRAAIEAGLREQADRLDGTWFDPGDVLAETTYLVEWPTVLSGSFGAGKLRLPAEVLITAMQSHQRYFPVRDREGTLLPVFLYVSNADPQAAELITAGNERVLEGRLDDAEFAYDRDVAAGLETMAGKLGAVVFHEKLGTLADKTLRLEALARWLVSLGAAGDDSFAALAEQAASAARLAKADLASGVVQEFPVLQGRMGELYARAAGLPDEVAAAIGEQYLPLSAVAPVPGTLPGALLAVADKIDNIVGAWVAGEKPTGSRDPYGLRRAAMGIVRIALEYDLRFPPAALVAAAMDGYARQGRGLDRDVVAAETLAFIRERVEAQLLDSGLAFDSVEAALGSTAADVPGLAARARAIDALRGRDFFIDVVTAYNRCAALAAKATRAAGAVRAELFVTPAEQGLLDVYRAVEGPVAGELANGEIESAIKAAAALRAPVDTYFDDVLVMDADPDVRENRLSQLAAVRDLLLSIGEFGRLAV